MKDVRLIFEKRGSLRFISHLDMNRFFTRVMRKSGLDIWYTEGFNPHPYITFALPLSLGFESTYEIVDFRVNDENLSFSEIENAIKAVVPSEIVIIKAVNPVLKTGKIAFTKYNIEFANENDAKEFFAFLSKESVVISKRTKRGEIKEMDVAEKLESVAEITPNTVELILPAGNDNINPSTLVAAFAKEKDTDITVSYLRTALLDSDKNYFI